MANAAILIGNSRYSSLRALPCCKADLHAMGELLEATEKYSVICIVEDSDADSLKTKVREAIQDSTSTEELFFYFSGHGYQHENDFYLCASDFDARRPNATGISTYELHALLRLVNADLVVKVLDACNSGTLLVKAASPFQSHEKQGFKNLIQISSCRENQHSLTGESLSVFTDQFRAAALRKHEGTVYYTDIVNSLRDAFIQNDDQTPFFVFQVTGRESFVEDARRLDTLRNRHTAMVLSPVESQSEEQDGSSPPWSLQELLEVAEQKAATPEIIESFVNAFFDALIQKTSTDEFSNFFDFQVAEHSDFEEPTTDAFIIRVLSRQDRLDEFVTASIKKERSRNPLSMMGTSVLLGMFGDDQRYREVYDLQLNCKMQRTQIRFTLTPKYNSLKKLVMVVSCAPSLHQCYIFEMGTQHNLTDFEEFSVEGNEAVRRWYRLAWSDDPAGVVQKVASRLHEIVREHLEQTEKRLSDDEA